MAHPSLRTASSLSDREAILRAAKASPELAGQHDKQGWLALYAEDAILEDPVGTPASHKGRRQGRLGDELGRFYEAFIAASAIRNGGTPGHRLRHACLSGGRHPHHKPQDQPDDDGSGQPSLRNRFARRRTRDQANAGALGAQPDEPHPDGSGRARDANHCGDELEHAARVWAEVAPSVFQVVAEERRPCR